MPDMFTMAITNALKIQPFLTAEEVPVQVNPLSRFMGNVSAAARIAAVAPPGSPVSPGSPGPSLPSGPAAATIIDSIPYVQDGDVIRAEQHNDLLNAIRLIARLLDTGEIAKEITVSAAPVMLPVLDNAAFRLDEGFARGPAEDHENVVGWMPLDLPDGYTIDSLRLRGAYPGGELTDWPVSLRRVPHGSEDDETVISGNLKSSTTKLGVAFDSSFAFDARGHSRAEADELSLVDTSKYRYQFHTTVSKAKPAADLKLLSIQVTCVRG